MSQILIVEDEPRIAAFIAKGLKAAGFATLVEESGVNAVSLAIGGEADLIVLDLPRSGAGRRVIEQVVARRPRAIAYVACDPAALARDLAFATGLGYRIDQVRAFDLFGTTHHVECLAVLRPS